MGKIAVGRVVAFSCLDISVIKMSGNSSVLCVSYYLHEFLFTVFIHLVAHSIVNFKFSSFHGSSDLIFFVRFSGLLLFLN